MFDELVKEFGFIVENGYTSDKNRRHIYAKYEKTYVMSIKYNIIYIKQNNLLRKFTGTKDEARLKIVECIKKIKAEKIEKRIYQLEQDFD